MYYNDGKYDLRMFLLSCNKTTGLWEQFLVDPNAFNASTLKVNIITPKWNTNSPITGRPVAFTTEATLPF